MAYDSWDIGGTPAWRARHRIIDVAPRTAWGRFKALPFWTMVWIILLLWFLAYAVPVAVLCVTVALQQLGIIS